MSGLPFIVTTMPISRYVVFACIGVFSIIELGAMAHYIALSTSAVLFVDGFQTWPVSSPDPFAALGLAVAVLSLILISPLLVIDFFRRGAFTSYIATEIAVLGFFMIMWLATAAYTTSVYPPVGDLCRVNPHVSVLQSACTDIQLGMAFGWLAWITILTYFVTLLTLAIISSNKGKPSWTLSVRGNDFGYGNQAPSAAYTGPGMQSNEQFLMQQQKLATTQSGVPYQPAVGPRYNAPQPISQSVPYDPSRPMDSTQYGYRGGAEV